MTWKKKNLMTLADMSDIWRCTECGYEKKYFGLERDANCPKCCEKDDLIVGWWGKTDKWPSTCPFCEESGVIVPTEGHPNSHFWIHKRAGESLYCCPNECREKSGKKNDL